MRFRRPRRTMRVDGVEVPPEELTRRRQQFRTPRDAIRAEEEHPDRPVPFSERVERAAGEVPRPWRRQRRSGD